MNAVEIIDKRIKHLQSIVEFALDVPKELEKWKLRISELELIKGEILISEHKEKKELSPIQEEIVEVVGVKMVFHNGIFVGLKRD